MDIIRVGADERMKYAEEALGGRLEHGRLFLLPIPSVRDRIHITDTDTVFSEWLGTLTDGDTAVGYDISSLIPPEHSYRIIDLAEDGEYTVENAEITAEAALEYVMAHSQRVLGDMSLGIIGHGRIGRALVRLALAHGCAVTLFSGRDMTASGIEVKPYSALSEAAGLDILINTAPCRIIDKGTAEVLSSVQIIELAGGDNLPYCGGALRLMALPGKKFPESAGLSVARAVKRRLSR